MGNHYKLVIIYKLTNIVNGKIYVGQTIHSLAQRMSGHLADSKRNRPTRVQSKISKAIAKYGMQSFVGEVVFDATSIQDLNKMEKELIHKLGANEGDKGYNLLSGGGQNGRHSDETRDKISAGTKRAFIQAKSSGRSWGLGRKHTESEKNQISASLKGRPCPSRAHWGNDNPLKNPETVAKMLRTRAANRLEKLQQTITSV